MKAGLRAVIFEKKSFVGGRMNSENIDGFIIDKSAYTIPEFYKNFIRLLGELGLENSLVETPGTSSTFRQGKEHKMKIGSPKDFLKHRLLSLKQKKDLVQLFLYAQSLGKALNLNNPTEKTLDLDGETTAEYLRREYDKELLECIAYPIFCELFLGVPENNSKIAFLATIRNLTRFKIFSLSQGMGMVSERLRRGLDVRLRAPVLKIHKTDMAGPYRVDIGGESAESLFFDSIIFAIPSPIVPQLFDDLPEAIREELRGVQYSPSVVTAMALDQPYSDASMMNCVLREDFDVLGTIVFDHHKGPGRIPPGKGLVTAILSENGSRNLFSESDAMITEQVTREMDTLFPGFSDRTIFTRVYRWEHAAVQLPPGTLYRQQMTRKTIEGGLNNLYFASDGLNMASIEVSVKTGFRAADRIIERMKKS